MLKQHKLKGILIWTLRTMRDIKVSVDFWRYRKYLRRSLGQTSKNYEQYLDVQLRRTLLKRNPSLRERTRLLIDEVAKLGDLGRCEVLCVGCRTVAEIDCFRQKGARCVVGIDLYSEHREILVMDMHDLTFPDNRFDIIYCSHCLEHSYDIHQVVSEFVRVGRPGARVVVEIPTQFETQGADLIDLRSLQSLYELFEPHLGRILWSEEQPPHTPRNESGTSIARTIFLVDKE
mgnify:CR=1 FL=1